MLNGAGYKPRLPLTTPSGKYRYPDRIVNGVAHEAKGGVDVKLSSVRKQIDRDAELVASRQIRRAHWHFFQGAEPKTLAYLDEKHIPYTVHP